MPTHKRCNIMVDITTRNKLNTIQQKMKNKYKGGDFSHNTLLNMALDVLIVEEGLQHEQKNNKN